jgi:hypothetical protein
VRHSDTAYRIARFDRARVMFVDGQADLAAAAYEAFVDGVDRTLAALALPADFPHANLFLAPSRTEFDRLVAHITSTPTAAWRVGQPLGHDLVLLSPAAYPADASPGWLGPDGLHDPAMVARLVVHEAVHMVEERFSPRPAMENRPLWWSEGLAVLISQQHRHDRDLRERLEADLGADAIPSLEDLRGGPVYTWAWAAVDRLIRSVGVSAVRDLITDTDGADILVILGLERERFDREWRAHAVTEARRILAEPRDSDLAG